MNRDPEGSDTEPPAYCFTAVAGEFPGAASVDALWALLTSGKTAPLRSLLPSWQVKAEAVFASKPGTRDRVYLDRAFTLDEPVGDPSRQVNIGLRVLRQLFREPSLAPARLPRDRIALILATSWSDESYFHAENGLAPGEQVRAMADALTLGGPAFTVDTACSSFPYALEMARGVMHSGQADYVVVMAINTVLPLALYLRFSQLTALSADACLRAFGAEANGIVPAESACAFLLEPHHLAMKAGREPLGMLTAIGLSSDGAEGSVFSPGEQAQGMAYQRAWTGLPPASADYLETHGTATPLGDATELASVGKFFAADDRCAPLTIGSVKATLGHTLAAAGGPSLAKALLMLRHQAIPAQPDYVPSPNLVPGALRLATAGTRGRADLQRIAISSFGFGGANAHLIIDRHDAGRPAPRPPAARDGYIALNLAIVDADAAFGGAFDLAAFGQRLQQPAAVRPFPGARLAKSVTQRPADGHYLDADCVIETQGYAMGPKALDRVDPFKLLVTALTGNIVRRHPWLAGNAGTAMMMCCNMGGESFSNAFTRSAFFQAPQGRAPDVTVADVATMLPSMLSGYAAKIFDFRGCHQTLAGEAGLLWHTLLTLPQWFASGLQQVLLGAGRYISSHSELRHCQRDCPQQGEGAGVLLLKPWVAGEPALVVLRGAVLAAQAGTYSEACRIAGIAPDQSREKTVCEINTAYQDRAQPLYQSCGWLAEASGIVQLLQQVLTLDKCGVIEVQRRGQPYLWLFSEHVQPCTAPQAQDQMRFPYTLRFAHPAAALSAPEEAVGQPLVPAAAGTLAMLNEQVSTTLLAGLHARSLIMQRLLNTQSRLAPRHAVVSAVQRRPDGWQATLNVDKSHPYFFDHPLDHVPGILLIEGALQLVEQAAVVNAGQFINDMQVRFLRYVGKSAPVTLWLGEAQGGTWALLIKQQKQTVCRLQFTLTALPPDAPPETVRDVTPCPRADLLHKHRRENVLVSSLFDAHEQYSVLTTRVPQEHFFASRDVNHLSMVYFLEIARQCYMQIAHDVMRVPTGTPMNLVTLHFSLHNAIPRQATLRVAADKAAFTAGRYDRTNITTLSLYAGQQPLGEANIIAQVLEPHDVTQPTQADRNSTWAH